MKNFRILPILCLMFILLTGFSSKMQAQYMSKADAIKSVNIVITQFEDRYGQIDRDSDKPRTHKRGTHITKSEELTYDLAKIKVGNAILKRLKAGNEVSNSIQLALQQFSQKALSTLEYQKAESFYRELLSI